MLKAMGHDACKEADSILLARFVSPAILVDAQLQAVQFRGETRPFMGPVSGAASLHVLKLVDESLRPALRYALSAVQRTGRPYRRRKLLVHLQDVPWHFDLEVLPLRTERPEETNYLIIFGHSRGGEEMALVPIQGGSKERSVAQLHEELTVTREHLQASVAEQETLNESLRATLEELQSTNEELQTTNEELQATNEELETGQEELQSTNEELTRAHDEVHLRNSELTQVVHDHVSLVAAASVAAVLFGRELQLRQFTPLAARRMRLTSLDIGKPLGELETGLKGCDLCAVVAESIEKLCPRDVEAHDGSGHHYALAVRPYRSLDGAADGAVMTIADVSAQRAAQEALKRAELRIAMLERANRASSN